jgi:hypothetical protein
VPATPYLPSPRTWIPGEVVKAPALRADVSGTVQLLGTPPLFAGQQTTTSQGITSFGTPVAVAIDTELVDNYGGHQTGPASNTTYYGMFPGWYLCEAAVPVPAGVSSVGPVGALIGGVQNGGALRNFGGTLLPGSTTATSMGVAAKLMLMTRTGVFGGSANDYIVSYVSAYPCSLVNSATISPVLTIRWVCAASGTAPLTVPANPAWPAPPAYVTSAFMNATVRNAAEYLLYPPVAEYAYSGSASLASQSAPPAVGTTVGCGARIVDTYGAYNSTSGVFTAPVPGVYYCYGCVAGTTGSNGAYLAAGLTVTSANYSGGSAATLWGGVTASQPSAVNAAAVRRRLRLSAGDTVVLAAFQNNSAGGVFTYTSSPGASGNFVSRIIVAWESA